MKPSEIQRTTVIVMALFLLFTTLTDGHYGISSDSDVTIAFSNAGVYETITEYTAISPSVYRLEIASYEGKAELITSDERYTGVLIRDYAQTELAALTEQNRQGGE
ncbi:MAG: hypothetical protein ILP12_04710 [Lachnospiraceae bacterium]|nr:hypothetical protein [Lachnospiraceae bacterium]